MVIGERIKSRRKRLGFSQEKIAELVGTSRQAATKWESGQSLPCMENLIVLADIFGSTISELTGKTDDHTTNEPITEVTTQAPAKKLLGEDIAFVLIAAFAAWSISRIPAIIGYSVSGFILMLLQATAIVYVPIYLFWIRPGREKILRIARNRPAPRIYLPAKSFGRWVLWRP